MKIAHMHLQSGGVGSYRHWTPAKALSVNNDVWWRDDVGFILDGMKPDDAMIAIAENSDIIHTGFSTHLSYVELLVAAREYAKRKLNKDLPIIIDCDDDLLNVPEYNIGFKAYTGSAEQKRIALLSMKIADALTVSTKPLVDLYAPYNDHIYHLPNCIEGSDWLNLPTAPDRSSSEDIRIIFAGGVGRKNDLDEIRPAIESIMRQRPNVRLFFMALMPDWAAQWAMHATDASQNRAFFISATDIQTYRRIMCWLGVDICLAPVVKNKFNAGKSNIKVLESGLYGAAAVCTDWDTYSDVPKDVVMKADTTYEWTESLLALIDDSELRKKKAASCKQWALDSFPISSHVNKWIQCYNESLARPVVDAEGNGIKENRIILPAGAVDANRIIECRNS